MYDMADSMWKGFNNTKTSQQRRIKKDYLAKMRWKAVDEGRQITGFHELPFDKDNNLIYGSKLFDETLPEDADQVTKEFFGYYKKRAFHPRSINSNSAIFLFNNIMR